MNVNSLYVDATLENGNGRYNDVILGNGNGSCVNVVLVNGSGSYVDVILVNGNDPGVDGNRTGWIPPHVNFPHYHPSFLGHLSPFYSAYLLPPTPNLSLVCATAPTPDLSRRITRALRHLILFGVFDMISL